MRGLALRPLRPPRPARRVAMTPLIDIVFILLLFFILETRFSEFRALWLPLPAAAPSAGEPPPRTLRLEVFASGRIWVAGASLDLATLGPFLARGGYAADTPVVLAAEPEVRLQALVAIADLLQAHGLQRLDLRPLQDTAP
jgi:biopolymer transport protein ExbD